jgi:hypothetical protein
MWDLFKAELLRFRPWALAAALVHLAILGFMTRMVDLAQQPLLVYRVFGGIYGVTGLLLGLFQMGGYRRANTWLNLLHRPMSPWRIALALTAACALLLAAAVGLPIALTALGQELFTSRVVDTRHFLLAVASTLIALAGYLAGVYALVGGKRHAVLVLVLPAWLAVAAAVGGGALAVQALVVGWLALLVALAFKPEFGARPRHPLALAAITLPVQMGALALFGFLGLAFEVGWMVLGSHPLNSTPAEGGYVAALNADGAALLEAGLGTGTDDRTRLWREQVRISQIHDLGPRFERAPRRGELTNLAPMEFDDEERRVRWVFSHDTMLFHGVHLTDGRAAGELGVGAEGAPFSAPALPLGADLVASAHALYQYDSRHQKLWPRVTVPAGELLAGGASSVIGDHVAVASDRALYFFDARELAEGDHPLEPRLRLPLPGPIGQLARVDLIELLDGYLVSFLFGTGVLDGEADAYQQVLAIDAEGGVEALARRALEPDGPALWRFHGWWPSPLLHALRTRAEGLFAPANPLAAKEPGTRPPVVEATAWSLLALSLLLALVQVRRLPLAPAARWAWVLVCGVVGLPALVSLWLLYPERESPVLAGDGVPATA